MARLANLWRGFLSLFIGGVERDNPEMVYEAAIQERQVQYQKLMKAVSGIVYLRNKTQGEFDQKTKALMEVTAQIPIAVRQGEEQLALQMIEQKNSLTEEVARLQGELAKNAADADKFKQELVTFQGEIEKLKRERESTIARHHSAKARIAIQEQLSGLSVEADIKALSGVREGVQKLEAQADIAREMNDTSMDSKMRKIKDAAKTSTAQAELEQYKIQLGLSTPATKTPTSTPVAEEQNGSNGSRQANLEKTL
ncbi:MAG: PspA/IM30 family protein [bacterium]|nr:PspA/IM30 family protein [bacterium]